MADSARRALNRFELLKQRHAERDSRMNAVRLVRTGNASHVFAGLFPDEWPQPVIANTISIAAEDTAEMVGVLPTLTAFGDSTLDESKRSRADKLTRIINAYVESSELGRTLPIAADYLASYGFGTFRIECDYESGMPFIHVDDAMGTYVERDRFLNVSAYVRTWRKRASELAALYPEVAPVIIRKTGYGTDTSDDMLEVVQFFDRDGEVYLLLPAYPGLVLDQYTHPLGRVPVSVASRPTIDGQARGAFDDALWVWAARAKLALLSLEATQKAVEAPIALPSDVQEFALGPDSLIRSQNPERIRRIGLDLPNSALLTDRNLGDEVRQAARFPEVRSGNTDASVVTGKGVQALMGGFDSRIKALQSALGAALSDALSMALELDEKVWGNETKTATGSNNGSPYTVKYNPSRDIRGDYGVSFEHGIMAGMDPNRSLVWSLQALGAGLTSKSFVRRNLPVSMNITEEEQVIDVEKLRDSLLAAVTSYAQAIPQMAATGEDPNKVLSVLADLVEARKKGTPIEEAAQAAFKPKPAPETPAQPQQPGEPGSPGTNGPQVPSGGAKPQGMQQLLAQLSGSGRADLSNRVVRQVPLAG